MGVDFLRQGFELAVEGRDGVFVGDAVCERADRWECIGGRHVFLLMGGLVAMNMVVR